MPGGNHYHTLLLLTTHCSEKPDAYNPEIKHLKGAFNLLNLTICILAILSFDKKTDMQGLLMQATRQRGGDKAIWLQRKLPHEELGCQESFKEEKENLLLFSQQRLPVRWKLNMISALWMGHGLHKK